MSEYGQAANPRVKQSNAHTSISSFASTILSYYTNFFCL